MQRPTGKSGGCVKELTKVFTLQWPALRQLRHAALKHGNCPKTMPLLWKLDRALPWTLSAAHGCKQGLLAWECEQMSLKPQRASDGCKCTVKDLQCRLRA